MLVISECNQNCMQASDSSIATLWGRGLLRQLMRSRRLHWAPAPGDPGHSAGNASYQDCPDPNWHRHLEDQGREEHATESISRIKTMENFEWNFQSGFVLMISIVEWLALWNLCSICAYVYIYIYLYTYNHFYVHSNYVYIYIYAMYIVHLKPVKNLDPCSWKDHLTIRKLWRGAPCQSQGNTWSGDQPFMDAVAWPLS